MAVVLKCVNGRDRDNRRDCTYEVRYKESSELEIIKAFKAVGGFDCPRCKGRTIKLKRTVVRKPQTRDTSITTPKEPVA